MLFFYFPEDYISHVFAFCQIEIFCASSLWQQKTFFNTVCNCSITSVGPNLFQSVENFLKVFAPICCWEWNPIEEQHLLNGQVRPRTPVLNISIFEKGKESFRTHFTKIVLLFLFYRFSHFSEREREYTKRICKKKNVKCIKKFVNIVAVEQNQFIKVSSVLACQHLGLMNNQNFCVHNTAAILQQLGLWF